MVRGIYHIPLRSNCPFWPLMDIPHRSYMHNLGHDHPDRLTSPLIKKNGQFIEATWDEALDLVAMKFADRKGDQFAALASAKCTNEENYLIQKFTRAVMGTNTVDHCARL